MILVSGLDDICMEELMDKKNKKRRYLVWAFLVGLSAAYFVAHYAVAQSGGSINLDSPVTFPVDI